jgi:hypothetical protein
MRKKKKRIKVWLFQGKVFFVLLMTTSEKQTAPTFYQPSTSAASNMK